MEIVNESFPRGNKFYAVSEGHHKNASKVFSLEMYNAVKFIHENSPKKNGMLNKNGCTGFINGCVKLSNDEFPKFKVNYVGFFEALSEYISVNIKQLKCNYQSMQRFSDLGPSNMPYYKDMVVQWDDIRKGFILYDIPYEGEMVTVPKSGISKAITEQLKDIVAETGMFEILGESLYVSSGETNLSQIAADKEFYNSFEDLLNGTQTYEQTTKIAVLSGAYMTQYCTDKNRELNTLPYNTPDRHKYYKLVKTKSNPKISTVTRQKLLFKYGGTRLPDNHMDWFDG
jgi:hypothetical protein